MELHSVQSYIPPTPTSVSTSSSATEEEQQSLLAQIQTGKADESKSTNPQASQDSPTLTGLNNSQLVSANTATALQEDTGSSTPENPSGLSEEEQAVVEALQDRDREVRDHERAHQAASGGLAGGASFDYQRGPDGQSYAIGGEVSIDTSTVSGDPQATIDKLETVRAAALAPAEPSSQDQAVAAQAAATIQAATAELQAQRSDAAGEGQPTETAELGGAARSGASESEESGDSGNDGDADDQATAAAGQGNGAVNGQSDGDADDAAAASEQPERVGQARAEQIGLGVTQPGEDSAAVAPGQTAAEEDQPREAIRDRVAPEDQASTLPPVQEPPRFAVPEEPEAAAESRAEAIGLGQGEQNAAIAAQSEESPSSATQADRRAEQAASAPAEQSDADYADRQQAESTGNTTAFDRAQDSPYAVAAAAYNRTNANVDGAFQRVPVTVASNAQTVTADSQAGLNGATEQERRDAQSGFSTASFEATGYNTRNLGQNLGAQGLVA